MTLPLFDAFERLQEPTGAVFSPCGTWRYLLWNVWDETEPLLAYVGCNPSKADGRGRWDLTARKFEGFARRLGYGGWYAGNLFGLVSTDPKRLRTFDGDPIGPDNDDHLRRLGTACTHVVPCWGGTGGAFVDRVASVEGIFQSLRVPLWCFGRTVCGHPRHPSRLAYHRPLIPYEVEEVAGG